MTNKLSIKRQAAIIEKKVFLQFIQVPAGRKLRQPLGGWEESFADWRTDERFQ